MDLNTTLLVSVIIPVHNAEQTLAAAMESACQQQVQELELVIVDDGSKDNSLSVARQFQYSKMQVHARPRCGVAAARNYGIQQCNGQVIAFLDADDLWPADRLQWQLPRLCQMAPSGLSLGAIQQFVVEQRQNKATGSPLKSYQFGAVLAFRDTVEKIGALDETLTVGEDLDWFMRALHMGVPVSYDERVALWYRVGEPGSLTHGKDLKERQIFTVLHRAINRRRNEGR